MPTGLNLAICQNISAYFAEKISETKTRVSKNKQDYIKTRAQIKRYCQGQVKSPMLEKTPR